MEECHILVAKEDWKAVLMSCNGDVQAAKETAINQCIRDFNQEVAAWADNQRSTACDTVINTPPQTSFDWHLIVWSTRTIANLRPDLQNDVLGEALEPWAVSHLARLKAGTETDCADECATYLSTRKSELREEAEAQAQGESHRLYQARLADLQAAATAEADKDFAVFRHTLKIETEAQKERARDEADKSVSLISCSSACAGCKAFRRSPAASTPWSALAKTPLWRTPDTSMTFPPRVTACCPSTSLTWKALRSGSTRLGMPRRTPT